MPKSYPGSDMLIDKQDPDGLIREATIEHGTPLTTANIFAVGALVTCKDDGKIYRNKGTSASPVWEDTTSIESSEMDQGLLKTITVSLSAAQLIAMYATPVALIPAVSGKKIFVESYDFKMVRTATQFTGGGVVNPQYDDTANGAGQIVGTDIAAAVVTGAAGTTHSHRVPIALSDIADASITGKGIYLSNKTAAFAVGTGTAEITLRYYVV